MLKKLCLSLCIIVLMYSPSMATNSRVRANSVCTKNGITYAQHGDGHWHRVVERDGRWYATGHSLGKTKPCN